MPGELDLGSLFRDLVSRVWALVRILVMSQLLR